MTDPVQFLRARQDEDEAAARSATPGPWRWNAGKQWISPRGHGEEAVFAGVPGRLATTVACTGPADDVPSMRDAEHIARWDPVRVLAEVAMVRALVRPHGPGRIGEDEDGEPAVYCTGHDAPTLYPCRTVKIAVQPHAGHPEFDPAWRIL